MADTIYALSSGALPAAIAVVRVSGVGAGEAARRLIGALPAPRHATLRTIRDDRGEVLDRGLCLWFPGPASVTGEDLLELHLHGGRAVVAAVIDALAALPGLRAAEAGEFTRRALISGRIDLSQAQGLADLLAAETERQRRAAVAAVDGLLGSRLRTWLGRLSMLSARVEALIDYDDEADVDPADYHALADDVAALAADLSHALARPPVDRLRRGIRVVLLGPPNSGKSSLFNAMVGSERSIVTDRPGTTRDVLEASVARDGVPFTLIDTAGLAEQTDDPVEAIGIERARVAGRDADILLWFGAAPPDAERTVIWVQSKADLMDGTDCARLPVSIHQPGTVERLWTRLVEAAELVLPVDDAAFDRIQLATIREVHDELLRIEPAVPIEIVAFHLSAASRAIASLLGIGAAEAMLDALFSRFCIGK